MGIFKKQKPVMERDYETLYKKAMLENQAWMDTVLIMTLSDTVSTEAQVKFYKYMEKQREAIYDLF